MGDGGTGNRRERGPFWRNRGGRSCPLQVLAKEKSTSWRRERERNNGGNGRRCVLRPPGKRFVWRPNFLNVFSKAESLQRFVRVKLALKISPCLLCALL